MHMTLKRKGVTRTSIWCNKSHGTQTKSITSGKDWKSVWKTIRNWKVWRAMLSPVLPRDGKQDFVHIDSCETMRNTPRHHSTSAKAFQIVNEDMLAHWYIARLRREKLKMKKTWRPFSKITLYTSLEKIITHITFTAMLILEIVIAAQRKSSWTEY